MAEIKIDLGSGYHKIPGYLRVDDDILTEPDVLINLDDIHIRLPFDDNSVTEIRAHHIFEHISSGFIPLMKELHRVSKHGALLDIVVPHHLHECYFSDPSHCRTITVGGMKAFSKSFNRESKEQFGSQSGIGLKYDIDFSMVHYEFEYDSFYHQYLANYKQRELENKISEEEHLQYVRLHREAANFAMHTIIKMMAVKETNYGRNNTR